MKIKLNESEKKVLTFWAILAVVVVSGLLVFRIVAPEKFNKFFGISNADKAYSLVKDRTRYYTVFHAVNKYYNYSNAKDSESVIMVLNDKYKQEKNINNAGDIAWPDQYDADKLTYNARLMCQKKLDIGIYSFYVSGFESYMNKPGRLSNVYYEVILDDNNFTFNIRPIDEKTFGGECHE